MPPHSSAHLAVAPAPVPPSSSPLAPPAAAPPAASALPASPAAPAAPVGGDDPVPGGVHAVIELFASQLAKVAFPEIDAGSLRRQADELRTEAKAVARAREQLEAALASFTVRRRALTDTAARAVAYARIYSEAHPDRPQLAAAIAALSEPMLAPGPGLGPGPGQSGSTGGKRRGRPPKRSAELFDAAELPAHDTGPEPG
jgi:hypothetical protein